MGNETHIERAVRHILELIEVSQNSEEIAQLSKAISDITNSPLVITEDITGKKYIGFNSLSDI